MVPALLRMSPPSVWIIDSTHPFDFSQDSSIPVTPLAVRVAGWPLVLEQLGRIGSITRSPEEVRRILD